MPGLPELLIILVIVMVLFGAGRIARIGGELGSGIAAFRRGLNDGTDPKKNTSDDQGDLIQR